MKKVLVVCGATASGKTDFAVRMAKRLSGEVISADCMLVYKGLDIGTAKPTAEEMQGVRHHMIDVVQPAESYSVGDYEKAALPVLVKLISENKTAVICGGTGFYIQSLCFERGHGHAGASPQIREKYERMAREQGNEAVFALLEKMDAKSAESLHPNDLKRVIRALKEKVRAKRRVCTAFPVYGGRVRLSARGVVRAHQPPCGEYAGSGIGRGSALALGIGRG